jgi:Glycosyltransferase like family 2
VISAVGIVVPARNEQRLIRQCLRGLLNALRQLPPSIEPAVCVIADRCTDGTAALAHAEFGGWRAAQVMDHQFDRSIGELRDLGFRRIHTALSPHPSSRILLLSTDADSTVASDWARQHVRLARDGLHAVAGTVDLADPHTLEPVVSQRYAAVLSRARRPEGHGNVYAANLGVRADAYRAVGGFAALSTGEDHDLWRRLRHAGYRCRYSQGLIVTTSARRHGRATGGLADLLRALHHDAAPHQHSGQRNTVLCRVTDPDTADNVAVAPVDESLVHPLGSAEGLSWVRGR